MRLLPFILILVVTIYALIDCIRYEEEPLPGGVPKPLWVVLILVLQPIAGIAWLVVSRMTTEAPARQSTTPTFRPPARPARPPRPMAPDDDPEFLASLSRGTGGNPTHGGHTEEDPTGGTGSFREDDSRDDAEDDEGEQPRPRG